jgi:glutathione S-transferase
MRLYFHPLSSNSRRVTLTARQLGLELDLVIVDLLEGEHRDQEFLKLNPNGKVPVLGEDGFALWESNAIIQHLADKKPGVVTPTDAKGRMRMAQWLAWDLAHWDSAWAVLINEYIAKPFLGLGTPDPDRVKEANHRVAIAAKVPDGQLGDKDFVLGERLTIVDSAR